VHRYPAVNKLINEVRQKLAHAPQVAEMFARCYPNTLETTVELLGDESTFVVTGDIPAMWLRDSSAQVNPYISVARDDALLQRLIRGLIQRQAGYILRDPYANAFNREPNGQGHKGDQPPAGPWVWERKYELDSLCYPIRLCYTYWKATLDEMVFSETVREMLYKIIEVMGIEQRHDTSSTYTFERSDPLLPSDTLPFQGRGTRTNYTGMIWSGFRPSDDACKFGFLIPANMFAVVVLGYVAEMARQIYQDSQLAEKAEALRQEVDFGISTYGIVEHPCHGRMYAYETDGYGNYNLMDDANVPSLLAIPYLGYSPAADPLYQNTRRFVLSSNNPYYYTGTSAHGIGSPHTPENFIWPIALIMRGLTSLETAEQQEILRMLATTTAETGYMHESFHVDDPHQFTRPWFAWANSLFGELVLQQVDRIMR
jgi:meiotically up-regulated gene 157 (Mug157) protein